MASKSKSKRSSGSTAVVAQRRSGKQAAFLEALASGLTLRDAAAVAGINPKTQRRWREASKKFEDEFQFALARGTVSIVREVYRRAVKGIAKPQFYQGRPVIDPETGTQLVLYDYSDTLLMFLANRRAELAETPVQLAALLEGTEWSRVEARVVELPRAAS